MPTYIGGVPSLSGLLLFCMIAMIGRLMHVPRRWRVRAVDLELGVRVHLNSLLSRNSLLSPRRCVTERDADLR